MLEKIVVGCAAWLFAFLVASLIGLTILAFKESGLGLGLALGGIFLPVAVICFGMSVTLVKTIVDYL